ncbi:hypothetical protein [Duganella rhizosphaerae]|uniref:hypothetical protein n=1 Tax=Duganella rhizosphaerae TaxID=2885763 RepID=UPI00403F2089
MQLGVGVSAAPTAAGQQLVRAWGSAGQRRHCGAPAAIDLVLESIEEPPGR